MHSRLRILAGCLLLSLAVSHPDVRAAGVGVTAPGHTDAIQAPADTFLFFPRRPGVSGVRHFRDLEFSLSANFSRSRGDATPGLSSTDLLTLGKFGETLTSEISNPFNAQYPDLWLIHDYLSGTGARYQESALEPYGFTATQPAVDPIADRSHIDHYIFEPGLASVFGGTYPSTFRWQKEDSSTGHWISSTNYEVLEENSTSFRGPALGSINDVTGTGWTRPDADANWGTIHEFQHFFNRGTGEAAMGELFSTAAEVLAGATSTALTEFDVNYTWSLLSNANEAGPAGPEGFGPNYTAWRLLSAYLLFNYSNEDTAATLPEGSDLGGMSDDLMYRWAHSATGASRTMTQLKQRLSNDSCFTCSQRAEFHQGGQPLSNADRLNVLLHNWRVANFVNSAFLQPGANGYGMYGYPPHFGFSPVQDVGAWRDNDTATEAANVVVFPAEVTARPSWSSRDTIISTSRSRDGVSYPLVLQPLGSEYWVIRSAGSIAPGADLVVRATADSIHRKSQNPTQSFSCNPIFPTQAINGRFLASLVGYTQQADDLWNHPEWADTVIGPRWVDIDSLAGGLEFVLPGFGDRFRAALLVLSTGDGPRESMAQLRSLNSLSTYGYHEATRYRLNLGLRRAPYQAASPAAFVESSVTEDHPAWSPDGTELAYRAATSPHWQIYRKPIAGGSATPLVSRAYRQETPDWSPRGDHIAFAESPTGSTSRIAVFRLADSNFQFVSPDGSQDIHPTFQPNGRRLAYARRNPSTGEWTVRRVNLDGTDDTSLTSTTLASPITGIRWSPDGEVVYFSSGRRLYSIPKNGGVPLAQDAVAKSVGSFDLPSGAGRIAVEERDSVSYYCESVYKYLHHRRIAIRDTTVSPRDTEMRFYRTGASFYSPRYSPDNRLLAYRSDQNSFGGGDLFIGPVIHDHAPVFGVTVRDTAVLEGQGLTINMTATDPDGDAIAYTGAYLPSGATITYGSFLWSNPTLTGAPHYVTLRALSPGGAVTSKVVRIDVVARPVAVSDLVAAAGRYSAAIAWTEPNQTGGEADSYEIRYRTGSTITEANFSSGGLISYGGAPGPQYTAHCVEKDVSSCNTFYFAMRTIRDGVPSFISNVASASTTCSGTSLVMCEGSGLYGGGEGGGSLRTGGVELSSAGDPVGPRSCAAAAENSFLGGAVGVPGTDLMRLPGDVGPFGSVYRVRLRQSAPDEVELDRISLVAVDHESGLEAFAGAEEVFLGTTTRVAAVRDAQGAAIAAFEDDATSDPVSFRRGEAITIEFGAEVENAALVVTATGPAVASGGDSSGILVQIPAEDGWQTIERFHPRREADARAMSLIGTAGARLIFGSATRVHAIRALAVRERIVPAPLALISADHSISGDVMAAVASDMEGVATLARGEEIALGFAATEVPAGRTRLLLLAARGQRRAIERSAGTMGTVERATVPVSYSFALGAARPNPTTGRVTIDFTLSTASDAKLRIFDVTGRLIRTLVDGMREAGPHDAVWDGRNSAGAKAGFGVYFYRLDAGAFRSERKVVVIRE